VILLAAVTAFGVLPYAEELLRCWRANPRLSPLPEPGRTGHPDPARPRRGPGQPPSARPAAGTVGQAADIIGTDTINYENDSVAAELRERTGGRGPDICIEALGMEADSPGLHYLYDQVKQQLRLETDRAVAVREAVHACRKGGGVFVLGVYGGVVDKFPLGAVMNKNLTLRGAQMHGHRYIPEILRLMERGEVETAHLATHVMPLERAPEGYRMFKEKKDGCVRAVFRPGAETTPTIG
jgi:threonine dehydrogenase-like Zn-dependent dehydrogenase